MAAKIVTVGPLILFKLF